MNIKKKKKKKHFPVEPALMDTSHHWTPPTGRDPSPLLPKHADTLSSSSGHQHVIHNFSKQLYEEASSGLRGIH